MARSNRAIAYRILLGLALLYSGFLCGDGVVLIASDLYSHQVDVYGLCVELIASLTLPAVIAGVRRPSLGFWLTASLATMHLPLLLMLTNSTVEGAGMEIAGSLFLIGIPMAPAIIRSTQ